MTEERAQARDCNDASVVRGSVPRELELIKIDPDADYVFSERAGAHGRYVIECIGADGKLKWREVIDNVVCTLGKNVALDAFLAGAAYTVTGPFVGLISSVSWSAVAAADTMASHAGWLEAGGANAPTYTGTRKTATWAVATAGSKALASVASFGMTGAGTVKGAFVCYGAGAVDTKDSTAGTLLSAGAFGSGDQAVINGDTLNVNYSLAL